MQLLAFVLFGGWLVFSWGALINQDKLREREQVDAGVETMDFLSYRRGVVDYLNSLDDSGRMSLRGSQIPNTSLLLPTGATVTLAKWRNVYDLDGRLYVYSVSPVFPQVTSEVYLKSGKSTQLGTKLSGSINTPYGLILPDSGPRTTPPTIIPLNSLVFIGY